MRKALGATRKQLIIQFVGESIIVAVVAMLIALALVELLMPAFAAFLEADMPVSYFGADGILLPVLALVLVVGILGGLYPAFFLSRFEPASVLKANKSSSETPGTGRLRNVLVVAQFAVSIGADHLHRGDLRPDRLRPHRRSRLQPQQHPADRRAAALPAARKGRRCWSNACARVPGVQSAGRTTIGVVTDNNNNTGVMVPGRTEPTTIGSLRGRRGLPRRDGHADWSPAAGSTTAGRWTT